MVARVAVAVPLPRLFDYLPAGDRALPPAGSRVLVPFGRRRLIGLVFDHHRATSEPSALRSIERVLDEALIDSASMALFDWCMRYYSLPPGEAVNLLLPGALRRIRPFRQAPSKWLAVSEAGRNARPVRAPRQQQALKLLAEDIMTRQQLEAAGVSAASLRNLLDKGWVVEADPPPPKPEPGPELNVEQRTATAAILAARHRFEPLLLAGVTGSGKTEVYLQAARHLIRRGRQVLILIPEIGLSAQLIRRIERRLGVHAHVYHSDLSEGERLAAWQAAANGSAQVLIGTRSAVFMPLKSPGLIVVDEEHDSSLKQSDGARYHGRDVAVLRARQLGIPVVLGSATPSLESLNNARLGRYRQLILARRAGSMNPPRWRISDQRGRRHSLDSGLREAIGRHLDEGGQVLIYRNRRGYAPVIQCAECGWQADCLRCTAHMTWHRQLHLLACHHCGSQRPMPPRCPDCGSPDLLTLGSGTERLEETLAEWFPETPLWRVDRDSMSGRHDLEKVLTSVREGQPCILVGTQMLAKGHHLPGLTLAVVLEVDQALFSADFRASERLGQTVFQVAGRAGRGDRQSEFMLQTRHPEHPLIRLLTGGDYQRFADSLLAERCEAELPPAAALALLRAESHRPESAQDFLHQALRRLRGRLEAHGPMPAIMARRSGYWRYQLWIQAPDRSRLATVLHPWWLDLFGLKSAGRVRWHLDMDPLEL